MQAVAGANQVFVGLGKLGFEVQHIRADGAACQESLAGDAQAFLDAVDGSGLDVGKRLCLQNAEKAAGDFVNELVAGGGKRLGAGFGPEAGHVPAGVALAVVDAPLGAKTQAQVIGVVGVVGVECGIHHVQLPLIQLHHERLDGIVAGGIGA